MANKPTIPKGTRDYMPDVLIKRSYIFNTIQAVFERFGFQPIETPAMENIETLTGKYGDEGDKLLFRILNSGDFLSKADKDALDQHKSNKLSPSIAGKGLRYDLTVPFARFVVMHRNELQFPFRRYQIQPVWRADRPQKGRYREFFQCDADIIGSNSLLNEAELTQIIDEAFSSLGIKVEIKLNNRKILAGIAEVIGAEELFGKMTAIIDKLDKIGSEKVLSELEEAGIEPDGIKLLEPILALKTSAPEKMKIVSSLLKDSDIGQKGLEEMSNLLNYLDNANINNEINFDLTLARGLNYYTGTIFEVVSTEVKIGSLCGGGRYDDLTGIFGLPNVSGVGISFGADRIYDVMQELDAFVTLPESMTRVIFVNFGSAEEEYVLKALRKVRENGVVAEIYPDVIKMNKQMSYANNRKIPFVVIAGDNERKSNTYTLKNMITGEQESLDLETLVKRLIQDVSGANR